MVSIKPWTLQLFESLEKKITAVFNSNTQYLPRVQWLEYCFVV